MQPSERCLFEAEESLRIISDAIDVGLWRWDDTGIIRFVNPAACQILEGTRKKFLGQSWSGLAMKLFTTDWTETVEGHWHRAMQGGRGEFTARFIGRKGNIKTLSISYYPIRNGKYLGTVGLIRDITTEQEVLRQLHTLKDEIRHERAL